MQSKSITFLRDVGLMLLLLYLPFLKRSTATDLYQTYQIHRCEFQCVFCPL
jgi:hypothetical protein